MRHEQTTTEVGQITFASGFALVGDPCYIDDKSLLASGLENVTTYGGHWDTDEGTILGVPTTPATVFTRTEDGRVMRLLVSFTGEEDIIGRETVICHLGVDAGLMMASDITHVLTDYCKDEYQDIRIYRHKETGQLLNYGTDFSHFEAPIASENGQTMNQLNAGGEWEQLPPTDDLLIFTYSGVCKYNEKANYEGTLIDDYATITSTGYGDGSYPLTRYDDANGNLIGFMVNFDNEEASEDDFDDEEEELYV